MINGDLVLLQRYQNAVDQGIHESPAQDLLSAATRSSPTEAAPDPRLGRPVLDDAAIDSSTPP